MRFFLLVTTVFSLYVLRVAGFHDFLWYWLGIGLALFVLQTCFDFGKAVIGSVPKGDTYNLTQLNFQEPEVQERSGRNLDPTAPRGTQEVLPYLIEQKRRNS